MKEIRDIVTSYSCYGCGVLKEVNKLEVYPYPEDNWLSDEELIPLFEIDCEPRNSKDKWKRVRYCHYCFHRLDPDMWINQMMWEHLGPIVKFEHLPDLQ
jgi:hypothetical protein